MSDEGGDYDGGDDYEEGGEEEVDEGNEDTGENADANDVRMILLVMLPSSLLIS